MSHATLMVHLQLGRPNTGLLKITAELAGRFGAGVVGIAARQPLQMVYGSGDFLDAPRAVDTGELVMQTGRPVLIVPSGASTLTLAHALIGWKDTRETRRAVSNALPLLQQAARVSLVEIARDEDLPAAGKRVDDVVAWLGRHGVEVEGSARLSAGDDAAVLGAIGQDAGADVVVAGAYGHSRLREWVFGGVTRDLLPSANRCSLVSH